MRFPINGGQGATKFFEIGAIRRLLRDPLAVAILFGCMVVLVSLWVHFDDPREFGFALVFAGIFLVPALSMAWVLVTELCESYRIGRRRRR